MHFIGRAMIAKGWLLPEALPPADSLRVELAGPARAIFFPDTARADHQDSAGDQGSNRVTFGQH